MLVDTKGAVQLLDVHMQAAVFQLRQQHWRLGDTTWRLIYLLQKAKDTAASLVSPLPLPRLGRRRTPTTSPDGSMRPTRAGSAEAAGQCAWHS